MIRGVLPLLAACSFNAGPYRTSGGGDGGVDGPSDGVTVDDDAPDSMPTTLREKVITIAGVAVGTHASFPLWVSLNDADIAARARTDGADIHFSDADGVPLAYEIQRWSAGELDAWVRVPTLTAGTQLAIRYGDMAAAHPADPAAVFSTYLAVWHLEDALSTTTIVETRGVATGTATGLGAADRIADAQLGAGANFGGGSDQIAFTNPLTGTASHTISMWINQRATTTNDAIVVLGNGSNNQARWFHSRFDGATIAVGFYGNDYSNPQEDIQGDGWTLLHWTFDGASRASRLYRDGGLVAGPFVHASGINTQGTSGLVGNAANAFGANMGILAALDEVRIAGVQRSDDWIECESINQSAPATFYTLGDERIPP